MTDDATTQQVEAIVKAAIAWKLEKSDNSLMERTEWELYTAAHQYGTRYKGLQEPQPKKDDIAEQILSSEAFLWLMTGSSHSAGHQVALHTAWSAWVDAGGISWGSANNTDPL